MFIKHITNEKTTNTLLCIILIQGDILISFIEDKFCLNVYNENNKYLLYYN